MRKRTIGDMFIAMYTVYAPFISTLPYSTHCGLRLMY